MSTLQVCLLIKGNLRCLVAFYCSNLDLNQTTLIYELKVYFWKMYSHTKNEFSVISAVIV